MSGETGVIDSGFVDQIESGFESFLAQIYVCDSRIQISNCTNTTFTNGTVIQNCTITQEIVNSTGIGLNDTLVETTRICALENPVCPCFLHLYCKFLFDFIVISLMNGRKHRSLLLK